MSFSPSSISTCHFYGFNNNECLQFNIHILINEVIWIFNIQFYSWLQPCKYFGHFWIPPPKTSLSFYIYLQRQLSRNSTQFSLSHYLMISWLSLTFPNFRMLIKSKKASKMPIKAIVVCHQQLLRNHSLEFKILLCAMVSSIADVHSDMADNRQDFISGIKHTFAVTLGFDDFSFLSCLPIHYLI